MTIFELFVFSIIVLIGFILGIFCGMNTKKEKMSAGIFHINTNDPEKDVISVELNIPIVEFMNKKEVCFIVENEEM